MAAACSALRKPSTRELRHPFPFFFQSAHAQNGLYGPLTNILQIEDLHSLIFYTEFQMYEEQTSLYHALI